MQANLFLVPIAIQFLGEAIQCSPIGKPLEFECDWNVPATVFQIPYNLNTSQSYWGLTWSFLEPVENGLSFGNCGPLKLIKKCPATFRILTRQEQHEAIFKQKLVQARKALKL